MPRITLTVAVREYDVAVREGDAPRFAALAAMVDDKAAQAARGFGGMTENRQLLFAALLIADQLIEKKGASAPSPSMPPDPQVVRRVDVLAERLERLASGLETATANP